MQKITKILDKVLFRMIPGGCFMVFFWRLMDSINTGFRTQESTMGATLSSVALVVFSANLLIWIGFDDVILPDAPSDAQNPQSNSKSIFLKNLASFLVTFAVIVFFNPRFQFAALFDNLVHTGAVYYGALMLGDVLHILGSVFSDFRAALSYKTRLGWIALFCYFVFLGAVVQYTVYQLLVLEEVATLRYAVILVPYFFAAFYRFQRHKKVQLKA